jgi:hypothetical protein
MNKKRQIFETRSFTREISDLLGKNSLLAADYDLLKKELAETPDKGDLLTGTGGVRKIRLKSSSRGKSGGFRVCYYYYVANEAVYLLFVFQKNEQENLTATQKKVLKNIVVAIRGENE